MRLRLFLLLAAVACSDSAGPGGTVHSPLGSRFRIFAEASGGDAEGRTAECRLDLIMELTGAPRPAGLVSDFPAIMGGEAYRKVLEADSSGFAFFADVYWPDAVARFGTRDLVHFVLGDTTSVEGGRFWREIASLRGTRDLDHASGTWTCAPFDIWENGYVDTLLIIQGTWRTEPL